MRLTLPEDPAKEKDSVVGQCVCPANTLLRQTALNVYTLQTNAVISWIYVAHTPLQLR